MPPPIASQLHQKNILISRRTTMLEQLKKSIKTVTENVIHRIEESNQNYRNRKLLQEKQVRDALISEFMHEMTFDLYEGFKNHSYYILEPIYTPDTIRIHDYTITNDGIVYHFSLDKKSLGKTAAIVLDKLQQNFNLDLSSAQRNIIQQCGYDYLQLKHPFLYYGIYVVDVADLGSPEIIISVITHLS